MEHTEYHQLADKPAKIILYIFVDDNQHLPFWYDVIPDKDYSIVVRKQKDDGTGVYVTIDEYTIPNPQYYWDKAEMLIKDQGIVIKDNRYTYVENPEDRQDWHFSQ